MTNTCNLILFNKKGVDGNTYSIVKEFDGYYLKCGINESEVDYISGFMNKKRDRFRSYGSALKRMNLIFKPLNKFWKSTYESNTILQPSPFSVVPLFLLVPGKLKSFIAKFKLYCSLSFSAVPYH